MKLQIVSDLHKEFGDGAFTDTHVKGDVLVMAGDTHVIPSMTLRCARKLSTIVPKVLVLGNHEFYGRDFNRAISEYKSHVLLGACNGYVLECDTLDLCGVRFYGATLWTDFADGMHLEAAMSGISDFKNITDKYRPITGDDFVARHKSTVNWLDEELEKDSKGKKKWKGPRVVVTHHAPSFLSCSPKFAGNKLNGAYFSNLDWLIEKHQPDLWIHGHTHESCDYRIGKTRVICNPFGYAGHEENPKFNRELIVEL